VRGFAGYIYIKNNYFLIYINMSMLAPLVVETIGTVGSEMGGMVSSMSAA